MNNNLLQVRTLISQLTPAECRELLDGAMSNASLRNRMLEERTAAIRAARRFHLVRDTPAASALARDLARYLATGWTRNRNLNDLPSDAPDYRRALHRIAVATGGQCLGKSTFINIFRGISD